MAAEVLGVSLVSLVIDWGILLVGVGMGVVRRGYDIVLIFLAYFSRKKEKLRYHVRHAEHNGGGKHEGAASNSGGDAGGAWDCGGRAHLVDPARWDDCAASGLRAGGG